MALSVLSLRCTRGAGGRVWVQVWTRGAVPVGRFRPRARASVILPTVGAVKNHEKPLFFMIFHGFPKIQSRVPVQPLNLARARGAKFPHTRHNPPRTHAHTRNAGFSTHTLQTTRERCSRQEADRVLSPYPHNELRAPLGYSARGARPAHAPAMVRGRGHQTATQRAGRRLPLC